MPESLSLTKTAVKLIRAQTLVHAAASTRFINGFNRHLGYVLKSKVRNL